MSDNELTISDYYEEYPIMRYILPGLTHNGNRAPQKNISNNAFILRQGAWVLSKILDDEHTEYGYETFHPAQRYVTAGGANNAVSVDRNKRNAMMASLHSIAFSMQGVGAGIPNIAIPNANMAIGAGNAYIGAGGGVIACAINPAINNHANALRNYITACHAIIDNNVTLDNNIYTRIDNYIKTTFTDVAVGNEAFRTPLNINPAGAGAFDAIDINNIIVHLCGGVPGNPSERTITYYNTLKITLPEPCDLPFYIIKSLISRIINSLGFYAGGNAHYEGMNAVQIVEDCILSQRFINFLANLATTGIDGNRNHRKTSFFHHLTAVAPDLNTPIGLYTTQDGGSYIVPYTDYEERSISTGGNLIDNRDLLPGVPAGAEPRMANITDRIRNGRKGDHIATVLTPDDVRLLAIFLQLAEENFNAPAAKTLYNSRNDVTYRDRTNGIRTPGTIASYFDHLIALRETDHTVRRGSGLNQGKVEALSVLAGLRYAIQGPIFPVLSQTVFHLVAHYFVRLVVHDSRAIGGAVDMNFHNELIYGAVNGFMRFLGGNGKNLQLLDQLTDQVSITAPAPVPAVFGCPDPAGFNGPPQAPIGIPVALGAYDHDAQVITFIQLIQSFIGPGTVDNANPASPAFERSDGANPGRILGAAPAADNMDATYDIIKKAHDDIRTFVTGMQFNYGTRTLQNEYAGGANEEVFHTFTGSLEFHGHSQLSNINLSTVEPTLFDTDIRHLLKYNINDRAIRVLGNEVHIIGTSTQNSFTGALVGPNKKLGNGGQFIINDLGVLEFQEIINGQVVQTDNSEIYNKIIGNNDYCKVFGSAKAGDNTRDNPNVCNTMISACSIIGNYGNPTKCATAFREIRQEHVSKNLRGWNALGTKITQLNAYKILIGMGFDPETNKDGDITYKDENDNWLYDEQAIFNKLDLSKGVLQVDGAGVRTYQVPQINNSPHIKYVQTLMKKVDIIKITKTISQKKDDIPTLQLHPFVSVKPVSVIRLGMHGALQEGGNNMNRQLNIMYGGSECDMNMLREKLRRMKENLVKNGIKLRPEDVKKLDKIIKNLEDDSKELDNIDIYIKAHAALKKNERNPLIHELRKKMDELREKKNKALNKIEKVKETIHLYLTRS